MIVGAVLLVVIALASFCFMLACAAAKGEQIEIVDEEE